MPKQRLLVTGSSGLIGSEVVDYFCRLGWKVHGVDNNMRADFFGPQGDTRWNQRQSIDGERVADGSAVAMKRAPPPGQMDSATAPQPM